MTDMLIGAVRLVHQNNDESPLFDKTIVEQRETDVFYLDGIIHVPHYTKPGYYVAPGGRELSVVELHLAHATRVKRYLWRREYE